MKLFDHENVVKVYGTTESKDKMIMELCMKTLYNHFQYTKSVPLEDIKSFAKQIATGMDHIHSMDIIHRDLTMSNVLLDFDCSTIKISDFGLAVSVKDAKQIEKEVAGSDEYIAPEMYLGGPITEKCDVWSFGVLLYCMLVGQYPFHGSVEKIKIGKWDIPEDCAITSEAHDLLSKLFVLDPYSRISFEEVLRHSFFLM